MAYDLKKSIEKKLGRTIEEEFAELAAFLKAYPYEVEVPRDDRPVLTSEELRYLSKYTKEHNLVL